MARLPRRGGRWLLPTVDAAAPPRSASPPRDSQSLPSPHLTPAMPPTVALPRHKKVFHRALRGHPTL